MSKFYIMFSISITLFLSGCYFISHKSFPNISSIEIKEYELSNGLIKICLPPDPDFYGREYDVAGGTVYSTFLYTRWLGGSLGDYPISDISVLKDVKVPQEGNALMLRKRKFYDDDSGRTYSLFRECFISNANPLIKYELVLKTSCGTKDFSTEAERDARLAIDDEIFDKVINSIRIKNKDGEWIKPPIVKLNDEVWKDGKRQ
ncbi:MAG: hypothetical protein WAX69_07855 [Victivallales bacterium]